MRDPMALRGGREEPDYKLSVGVEADGKTATKVKKCARLAGSLTGLGAVQGGSWDCPGVRVSAGRGGSGEGAGKQEPIALRSPLQGKVSSPSG